MSEPPTAIRDRFNVAIMRANESVERAKADLLALTELITSDEVKPYRSKLRTEKKLMMSLYELAHGPYGVYPHQSIQDIHLPFRDEFSHLLHGEPTMQDQEETRRQTRRERDRERRAERKARDQDKAIQRENDAIRAKLRAEAGLPPD